MRGSCKCTEYVCAYMRRVPSLHVCGLAMDDGLGKTNGRPQRWPNLRFRLLRRCHGGSVVLEEGVARREGTRRVLGLATPLFIW